MTEKNVKVLNRAGIHARPAALVVQAVKDFKCNIYFERENDKINAKSIMGVITLGAAYGTELKIVAEGEGEQEAVDVIVHLFETRFEED
jgi:phosphocarrier protein